MSWCRSDERNESLSHAVIWPGGRSLVALLHKEVRWPSVELS